MFLRVINSEGNSTKQAKRMDRGQWNTEKKGKMQPVFSDVVKVKITKSIYSFKIIILIKTVLVLFSSP